MKKNLCVPHLERLGQSRQARYTVVGTSMCDDCFAGKPCGNEVRELRRVEQWWLKLQPRTRKQIEKALVPFLLKHKKEI